jgi:uncharacterized membrane protein (UPF0182 family)
VSALIVTAGASGFVVDWAWFSTIGYVGVFWTILAAKAVLFIAVFVLSTLLFWVNGALALRFASRRRSWLPAALDPGFATDRTSPGTPTELFAPASPMLPWRLIILAVALVAGLLIAIGETGKWDLILRFFYQTPYGQTDPLFDKDIGFYLFSLPVYIALKNSMLWILFLSALMAGAVYFLHGQINLDRRPWRVSSAAIAHGSVLLGLYFAVKAWSYALDRFLLLYNDNGVVFGAGYTTSMLSCPCSGCSFASPLPPPLSQGPICGCAHTGLRSPRQDWSSAARSSSPSCFPGYSNAFTWSRASCSWKRRTLNATSPSPGRRTIFGRLR